MSKLREVMDLLRENYGVPKRKDRANPILSLIQVILSQNTNDANRDQAWKRLMGRFDGPEDILKAGVDEIAEAISPAGLHNLKAGRIKESLEKIKEERGRLSLDFLENLGLEEARDWLLELPGVGPKSAAVILNFSFEKPAFPVDTHVFRVSKRLGLIQDVGREGAHEILERKVPAERMYGFHLNLIRHGRKVCKARKPRCGECFLTGLCGYYKKEVRGRKS